MCPGMTHAQLQRRLVFGNKLMKRAAELEAQGMNIFDAIDQAYEELCND